MRTRHVKTNRKRVTGNQKARANPVGISVIKHKAHNKKTDLQNECEQKTRKYHLQRDAEPGSCPLGNVSRTNTRGYLAQRW